VPAGQVSAVMDLFDDYLRYRRAAAELAERSSADSYFEELKALQSEVFGEHAGALFGRDNRMAEYSIARKAIATHSGLSASEKQERLAELEATLPEPLRELRAVMNRQTEVSNVVEQMRRDGLSEEDVFEYRSDEFGEAAAERLAELDSQRAEWTRRLGDYRAQRNEILARNLAEGVEEAALEDLRQEHFDGPEVRRVRALDRTEGSEAQ
ncbi:MAG: lipase secretion chaperone, partial [Polyangiales bacterium]